MSSLADKSEEEIEDEAIREAQETGKFTEVLKTIADGLADDIEKKFQKEIADLRAYKVTLSGDRQEEAKEVTAKLKRLPVLSENIGKRIRANPNLYAKRIADTPI